MKKLSWVSSPFEPSDDSSPKCHLTIIARKTPSENWHPVKPNQPTELWQLIIHCHFKPLSVTLSCSNRYLKDLLSFSGPPSFSATLPHVPLSWSLSNFRAHPHCRAFLPHPIQLSWVLHHSGHYYVVSAVFAPSPAFLIIELFCSWLWPLSFH